jgi:LmbE family N-acetylglucosaminyl deacetylase
MTAAALDAFAAMLADPADRGGRLLVILAHPDDETIALGGHLMKLADARLVCLTDGAPGDLADARRHGFATAAAYAAARRRELASALALVGCEPNSVRCLGIPDQQAARRLADLSRRLTGLIKAMRPDFVLTHAYEGGHPDHDAAAFAAAAACHDTGVALIEAPFYHLGPAGTVYQRFPSAPAMPELEISLPLSARRSKGGMLACFATQAETLAPFTTNIERFRLAPPYDFRRLPNEGRLQYEEWRLGLSGAEWLRFAGEALDGLGLDGLGLDGLGLAAWA